MNPSISPHLHVLVPNFHSSIASLERHVLASVRMRSALIARAAEILSWRVTLGERFDNRPTALYVGKIGGHRIDSRGPAWLEYVAKARARGAGVIVDYTDHYCGFNGVMTDFYNRVLRYADIVVTPSSAMTKLISRTWQGDVIEIADPCEIQPQKPRSPGPWPWRALWFGSCTNISYLINFLSNPKNLSQFRQINIVTDNVGLSLLQQWTRSRYLGPSFPRIESLDWSLKNLVEAAGASDIVIIPSDPNDPRKAGVSENRLVTAVQLGLVTVADLLPAYRPFSELFVPINADWPAAVFGFTKERIESDCISVELARVFSKSRLIECWKAALLSLNRTGASLPVLIA